MLPETIYEVDLIGNITFVNLRAFDIFGYTKNDVANGINILNLIHEKDREKAKSNITKILNGKDIGINEYYVQKKDGSFIPALLHSSVIFKDKEPIGFRGFLIDISEKKRTQEILKQNEKMMSVGGLAAGMAHEINNPLAGMIQNAQVISNRLSRNLPGNCVVAEELGTSLQTIEQYMQKREVFKLLDNIKQAGQRAAGIVDNMLSFARKNEGGKSEKRLDELIESAIELAYSDYNLKKI